MVRPAKRSTWAAALLSMTLASAAPAQIIELQTESYTAAHNIANRLIGTFDTYVYGLDYPGEWTSYELDVAEQGIYAIQLLARGDLGLTCRLEIVLTTAGSGDEQVSEISFLGDGVT